MKDEKHFGKRVKRPETVEEEAVEMNSTAKRGWSGPIMAGESYVKGGLLSKRKLVYLRGVVRPDEVT